MKSLNSVSALLIAATLLVGATGCKKGPKNPTFIPRPTVVPVNDESTPGTPIASNPKPTTPITRQPVPTGNTFQNDPNLGANGLNNGNTVGNNLNPGGASINPDTLTPEQKSNQTSRPEGAEDRGALASETLYFDLDKASVKASERSKVERVAAYLKADGKANLRVEGNADERGTEEYNRSLGERRALAVREYLVNLGIAPERVTTLSFGEDKPANPGHDEAAWAQNRRAEFVVIHSAGIQ
jgi:peptidoglycan-associated lipoprotein